jgi:ribosomal protein L37AE/L43A
MTDTDIRFLPVTEGEWRQSETFVCRTCGHPAFYHPYTNRIWGCATCIYTTASVSLCFMKKKAV